MDRESRILTSWYGAARTAGVGTANADATASSASSRESTSLLEPGSLGRIATGLRSVLRSGISKSATNQHSLKLSESARGMRHEIHSARVAHVDGPNPASVGGQE